MSTSEPTPIDADLADVMASIAKARAASASPEAIAAYDRSIADARTHEERSALERKREAIVATGIPLREAMVDAIVGGTLRSTDALRTTIAWLAGPRQVLVLIGDPGTGKTTAAGHAGMTRLSRGPLVYVKEPTLARWSMFARYDRDWQRAVDAPTLILDEAGTAEPRDLADARAGVSRMLDDRIGRGRKTIVIGNLSEADLARRYDRRMLDRLREIGFVAEILGPSMRGGTP